VAVSVSDVIDEVLRRHPSITKEEILKKDRRPKIVNARFLAIYISRTLTSHSTTAIGRIIGGRDHSTVIHATQRVEKMMRDDLEYSKWVARMCQRLVEADRRKTIAKRVTNMLQHKHSIVCDREHRA